MMIRFWWFLSSLIWSVFSSVTRRSKDWLSSDEVSHFPTFGCRLDCLLKPEVKVPSVSGLNQFLQKSLFTFTCQVTHSRNTAVPTRLLNSICKSPTTLWCSQSLSHKNKDLTKKEATPTQPRKKLKRFSRISWWFENVFRQQLCYLKATQKSQSNSLKVNHSSSPTFVKPWMPNIWRHKDLHRNVSDETVASFFYKKS